MIVRRETVQDSPLLPSIVYVQSIATMSLPITLSFWLFGPAPRVTPGNAIGRFLLASFAAVWMSYLMLTYMIGGEFALQYYYREYLVMGVLLPLVALLAGYFGVRRRPVLDEATR